MGQDEAISILPAPNKNAIEQRLTPREAEIARLVAAGLSNKQIARKTCIAEATVKIHLHKTSVSRTAPRWPLWSAQTLARGVNDGDEAFVVAARTFPPRLTRSRKETSPSRERGEVSEGVGGSTGEEEHRHPLTK